MIQEEKKKVVHKLNRQDGKEYRWIKKDVRMLKWKCVYTPHTGHDYLLNGPSHPHFELNIVPPNPKSKQLNI